jgi:hypothetical protein
VIVEVMVMKMKMMMVEKRSKGRRGDAEKDVHVARRYEARARRLGKNDQSEPPLLSLMWSGNLL